MPRRIARRTFVLSLGALGGSVLGAASWWHWYARAKAELIGRLADFLAESQEVQQLGEAYLAYYPSEADAESLTVAVSSAVEAIPFFMSDGTFRRLVRARVTQDFEQGRIVTLDGWVFAQTELHLCALAALRSKRRVVQSTIGVLEHRRISLDRVSEPKSEGGDSTAPGAVLFEEGLTVSLDRKYRPRRIELTLDANDMYEVSYLADGVEVGTQVFGPRGDDNGRFALYRRPISIREQSINAIRFRRKQGRYPYSLGHLRLVE